MDVSGIGIRRIYNRVQRFLVDRPSIQHYGVFPYIDRSLCFALVQRQQYSTMQYVQTVTRMNDDDDTLTMTTTMMTTFVRTVIGLIIIIIIITSCARAATICPRPSPPSVGAEAPHAAEPTAPAVRNVAVGSHGQYVPTAAAA